MSADHRKPAYQAKTDLDLLAELTALTASSHSAVDSKTAAALADMERLSRPDATTSVRRAADQAALAEFEALTAPAHRKTTPSCRSDDDLLAEITALTTSDSIVDSKTTAALADLERLSHPGSATSNRSRTADAAALAGFEALSTPEPRKKPSATGDDVASPEPKYSLKIERALYQSQIDLVNAFRPSPRKRRRDLGYDR